MAFFSKIRGTFYTLLQLGGKAGAQWKSVAGPIMEARNATDAAYIIVRGLNPVGAQDFATKTYVDTANTANITVFFPAETAAASADYRAIQLNPDGGSGLFQFNFQIPANFSALVSLELIGWPNSAGSAAGPYDLTSDYGAVGEQFDAHSEADLTGTADFSVSGQKLAINLASVFSSLAPGDSCGVTLDHNTVGAIIGYTHIKLVYTPTTP